MISLEPKQGLKQDILNLYKKRKEELDPYKIHDMEKEIAAKLQTLNKLKSADEIQRSAGL